MCRMLGVTAAVLAENVPKLRIIKERPYLRVVGTLEVVAWLSRPLPLRGVAQMRYESFGATALSFVSFTGSPASPPSRPL